MQNRRLLRNPLVAGVFPMVREVLVSAGSRGTVVKFPTGRGASPATVWPAARALAWAFSLLAASRSSLAVELPPVIVARDGAEMVLLPADSFVMGSMTGAVEEAPPHVRYLPALYIDRTEVTVGQYARFLEATGHQAPPGWHDDDDLAAVARLPVTNIRWHDALQYALWAGKRLPTEAEWERAARGTDGRSYPWGNADQPDRRNLDSGKLLPVGQYTAGVSPCGCQDMSGNAWEWTADWFLAYPDTAARSVHFGPYYKVLRGGGGEYLYGTVNTGTTFQRARLVPYGSHDFVGFRCVQDPPGTQPPYQPDQLLQEARERLELQRGDPHGLDHEREFGALLAAGRVPLQLRGGQSTDELVVSGLPLPIAAARAAEQVEVLDADGQPLPLAATPLAHWPDGSIRWLLLRFRPARGGHVAARIRPRDPGSRAAAGASLLRAEPSGSLTLDTGTMRLTLDRAQLIRELRCADRAICSGTILSLSAGEGDGAEQFRAGPADTFEVESQSALHADIRWQGPLVDDAGHPGAMRYDLRLRAGQGSSRLRLWLTLVHARERALPWEERRPRELVTDWRLGLRLVDPCQAARFGVEGDAVSIAGSAGGELLQSSDLQYHLTSGGRTLATGTRAPGWCSVQAGDIFLTLGVRHFWQNHPGSLFVEPLGWGVRGASSAEPWEWEGGLAKTLELVLDAGQEWPAACDAAPRHTVPPPAWMCGSAAAGALLPRNAQAIRQFAYWECRREADMRRWVAAMPTGWRDFGDAYLGGPYKGRHAYANLEYDVTMNFLHQFLRTGDSWYLEHAQCMARHQADIDTENVAGFAWKHSPLHTTTPAEFGHVFLRGLLLHHLLTGDARSLETARRIGDWIARDLLQGRGVGNERQIGWSLYALSALYETTRETRYLEAAQFLTRQLAAGQTLTGKFNIRWDNRIAFFNGIAMSGMLSVNELAPDERVETAIERVAQRTLGMYPEYACRTLNAFCWALSRTDDPRYLDALQRTWASTQEFLLDRDTTTSETHGWQFLPFAVRYDICPQLSAQELELPQHETWRAQRLTGNRAELYIRTADDHPAPILIVREGLARGTAELISAAGKSLAQVPLIDPERLVQTAALQIPSGEPWVRLRLHSANAHAWQVHCDQRAAVVVADRDGHHLPDLLPRAYGALAPGAGEVTLRFAARGEGYHFATLFNPQGTPVGRVSRFIDFEDPGRYELELKVSVAGPPGGWALEVHALELISSRGLLPYWSTTRDTWFHPEVLRGPVGFQ